MKNSTHATLVVLPLALALAGCGPNSPQVAPTTPIVIPAAPAVATNLIGYVGDTGLRPVTDATIEVLQGPQAGTVLTSDAAGRFSYTGTFPSTVTMRASKAGYASATETVRTYTTGAYIGFNLASLVPPVQVAGDYSLTIAADPSCSALPGEVRTRTYSSTVTVGSVPGRPVNTWLDGVVTGGQFAPYGNTFWIGVFGDYVGFSTNGEGPTLVEQIAPNTYVAYAIDAGAPGVTSNTPTISVPFTGTIEYCERNTAIGAFYECTTYARREQCTGANGRLTLTRR